MNLLDSDFLHSKLEFKNVLKYMCKSYLDYYLNSHFVNRQNTVLVDALLEKSDTYGSNNK